MNITNILWLGLKNQNVWAPGNTPFLDQRAIWELFAYASGSEQADAIRSVLDQAQPNTEGENKRHGETKVAWKGKAVDLSCFWNETDRVLYYLVQTAPYLNLDSCANDPIRQRIKAMLQRTNVGASFGEDKHAVDWYEIARHIEGTRAFVPNDPVEERQRWFLQAAHTHERVCKEGALNTMCACHVNMKYEDAQVFYQCGPVMSLRRAEEFRKAAQDEISPSEFYKRCQDWKGEIDSGRETQYYDVAYLLEIYGL